MYCTGPKLILWREITMVNCVQNMAAVVWPSVLLQLFIQTGIVRIPLLVMYTRQLLEQSCMDII